MDINTNPSPKRWAVLAVVFFGCFMGAFTQFVTTAFGGYLMGDLGLSTSQFSAITMCPMLTGIFFSIPAGTLADKYGVGPAQIPVAWAIAKGTLPIIGVTQENQVLDAVKAANVTLTAEETAA